MMRSNTAFKHPSLFNVTPTMEDVFYKELGQNRGCDIRESDIKEVLPKHPVEQFAGFRVLGLRVQIELEFCVPRI